METILLIDDEPGYGISLKRKLDQKGYQCIIAESGSAAKVLALKTPPDIILCDVLMFEMNGYETFETFRQEEQLATIPFIFITALNDPVARRHGMNLGADDFLYKPFTAEEAVEVIEASLSRQRMLVEHVERKLKNMQKHLDEIKQLSEVTAKINAGLLLDDICQEIYDLFKSIIPYNRIGLSLIEENGATVRARWAKSEASKINIAKGYSQPLHGSSLENVLKTRKPLIINNIEEYSIHHPDSQSTKDILDEGVRSSLTCPLILREKNVGFLFFSSFKINTYKNEHAELYEQIAGLIAIVIEKARLYQELIELNNLKNKFLGIAAHDLRNPLNAVIGFSDLLMGDEQIKGMKENYEMLQFIRSSGESALRLINDLLDVSAIESGQLVLKKSPVDIQALLATVLYTQRMFASKKDIAINLDTNFAVLPKSMEVDGNRIQQVLDNYLSNAIKFSGRHTCITIRVQHQGDYIRFEICDQGQGIPPNELSKLFKEYSRTSVLPTAGEESTGLGLAIVKKIVKEHGGEVGATSEVGKGSVFYFTVPLKA